MKDPLTIFPPLGLRQKFDVGELDRLLKTKGEDYWQTEGARRALKVFHQAASRVPAYCDFLKKNKIDPDQIKTIEDFKSVPFTDAKNYTSQYSLADRSWDGSLRSAKLIATSSGTSGEPKFWPRDFSQEGEATIVHELLYRNLFQIDQHRTLLIIGFPMGIYVSGIATLLPTWLAASGEYDLTIVSAGNNKNEVLRAVKHLQAEYEQIILVGHPFFIKDVIETGRREKIDWSKRRLKMMFCSEGFSEGWRRYLSKEAGLQSGLWDIFNTYGSSEMLLMAYETPVTVLLRNILDQHTGLRKHIFGEAVNLPNLFQYNPLWRYIESEKRELLFTSTSGLPLIRYNLHDSGQIVSLAETEKMIHQLKPRWLDNWRRDYDKSHQLWRLPLVALWGRSDNTIIFYAANIYPEHIQQALSLNVLFSKLTGKFVMRKDYLDNMDQFLEINIELRKGIKPSKKLEHFIRQQATIRLKKINSEYLDACNHLKDKDLRPRINLWPYQDEKYFKPGLKPKYIYQS